MLTDWLLVALGVLLTAGTAVFVAGEFSLVTLDPAAVEAQADDDPAGRRVLRAVHTLSTQLSGAQVGITATTVLLGYTTQPAVGRLLERALHGPVSAGLATGISVALALVLVNAFSMLVGELIPKNFALAAPLDTAKAISPFQLSFTTVLRPLIAVFNGSANWLLRRVGVEPREELSGSRSASELAALVRRSAEQGTLDEGTATLLTNSLDFGELTAVDVMTDRLRLVTVRRDDTAAEVQHHRDLARALRPLIGDGELERGGRAEAQRHRRQRHCHDRGRNHRQCRIYRLDPAHRLCR